MLLEKIQNLIDHPNKSIGLNKVIKKYYHLYDFYTDSHLKKTSILRYLNFIKYLLLINKILKKNIYIPGVGHYKFSKRGYNFLGKIEENLTPKIKKIIKNDKIDYLKLNEMTFQVQSTNTGKYTFFSSMESKIDYIHKKTSAEDSNIKETFIPYSKEKKISALKKDFLENKNSLESILKHIDITGFYFNPKLCNDILFCLSILINIESEEREEEEK